MEKISFHNAIQWASAKTVLVQNWPFFNNFKN